MTQVLWTPNVYAIIKTLVMWPEPHEELYFECISIEFWPIILMPHRLFCLWYKAEKYIFSKVVGCKTIKSWMNLVIVYSNGIIKEWNDFINNVHSSLLFVQII